MPIKQLKSWLAQLGAAPFDLVVTDNVMPEMEGIELIERLRRGYPGLPVIAMLGGGRVLPNTYLAVARAMGASRILIKPFVFDELLAAIDALLKRE